MLPCLRFLQHRRTGLVWCVQVRGGVAVRCAGPSEIVDAVLDGWQVLRADPDKLAWLDAHKDELCLVPVARVELIERRHSGEDT